MRNTIEDKEKLADKLTEDDKQTITDAISETQDWLNSNQDADKDEYEQQLKDLQSTCDPIIAAVYKQYGGQGGEDEDEDHEEL